MRLFHVAADRFAELPALPDALPPGGFVWIGVARSVLDERLAQLQAALHRLCGTSIVDLHVPDRRERYPDSD